MTTTTASHQRTDTELGVLAGSVAVFFWGLGPLLVRAVGASTPTVVAYRFILATPAMWFVSWLLGGRVSVALFKAALVPGVLFGLSMIVGFAAVLHTSVSNAALISNLMPVAVVLIAKFGLHQHVRTRQVVAVFVAMAGVVIVVVGADTAGDATLYGDFLALVNVVLWTAYFMRTKRLRDEGFQSWSLLAAVTTVAAIVAVPPCLLVSDDLGSLTKTGWWYLVAMVLLPGVLGHGLMTWASGLLPVTVSSLLTLGSPVVSAVGAWVWLEQSMTVWQCVGSAIVLVSLGVIAVSARSEPAQPAGLSDPPD